VRLIIPLDEISRAMAPGRIDRLTTVLRDDVEPIISQIRLEMQESNSTCWDLFYTYLRSTWMNDYNFNTWNISSVMVAGVNIQNRINNALVCFNEQLNAEFSTAHPNLFNFTESIRDISIRNAVQISDKRKHGN
jgi:hypothetical protein